jgi:AraC-like DNA-binding protein
LSISSSRIPFELAELSGIVDEALTRFRRLSGFSAVASIELPGRGPLLPAVHPRCTRAMRTARKKPPCDVEWRKHLQHADTKKRCRRHVCSLGLRCATVPVMLEDKVVGLVKCVTGPETTPGAFSSTVELLEVLVNGSSHEIELATLRRHIGALQRSLELKARAADVGPSVVGDERSTPLVTAVVEYIHRHCLDPELDLARVAKAVHRNEKYVAHEFVLRMGMRMRSYINNLRLHHASELLLRSERPVEDIARECGFTQIARFRELFRRSMGVTPSQYRKIFAGALTAPRVD